MNWRPATRGWFAGNRLDESGDAVKSNNQSLVSSLYSPEVVFKADDVVFAEIVAALDFDEDE